MQMKILTVDDHPLIRDALRQVLGALDERIELLEAQNCTEAIEQAAGNPDLALILLDLALRGSDGFVALRELRHHYPAVPVVVLSASDQSEVVTRAIDGGAMGFIPKTSTGQGLLSALRLVLAGGVYLPLEVLHRSSADGSTTWPAMSTNAPREIGLTERQAQVLALVVQGKPNKLICRELNLAEGTVKIHVTAILKALNVTNRTQAVIAVSQLGLKLGAISAGTQAPGGA